MPEKSLPFWIALAIMLFALFACMMVIVQIVRLRRAERIAAREAAKKEPALRIPPKITLE